ncbi:hypothetical protein N8328_04800 [Crocinitomicaceae bacterium]|jgi:hypothetical protein|nr:hypothetical protein [Crocinitomicaceae bacterium]
MAFLVNVFMINELYSQEFADTHQKGEESEDNKLFEWEDEMSLKGEIMEVDVERDAEYIICGDQGEGNPFEVSIPKMCIFNFIKEDNSLIQIACSESLYEEHELIINDKILTLFLKGEPYANPIPGIYIASREFPKELMPSVRD